MKPIQIAILIGLFQIAVALSISTWIDYENLKINRIYVEAIK